MKIKLNGVGGGLEESVVLGRSKYKNNLLTG